MTQIYFAAPLFSDAERHYNQAVVNQLRQTLKDVEIFLPQEDDSINDKDSFADSKKIALADTEQVLSSQLLIAVLDGLVIDPGVASEIGVAYQAGIPIIGLYTDARTNAGATNPEKLAILQEIAESQFSYINLYTVGLIKLNGEVVASIDALLEAIPAYLA
ncbi:nucleoside 2-deoxyribosyltransferase [Suicoccus acidiformans]|uniref:Nucleoside 2-deoxyribosyltransferase n=1 Tax=Suicoccus acidiformans TaxID=2036206 RepID=A0A347WMZ0_9LACT|nr:nucleoside 2-deoxyribosyltransferase [Suicoccus acidiformans]AXY26447.1 nucleoside 2-deoxyribosyltransferase [Suicoccus acidiformans]